jgi:hypothetical protein
MAKKIISARMQQRKDTRAAWEAANPVLLDGELGLVSDDPGLYKMGDGVTPWNGLPYRGFDGSIVQETGSSTKSVMSQAAVTRELEELRQQIVEKPDGTYESGLSEGETVQDFGDIKAGTTVDALKDKSYDQLFDAILFPTVNPTFAGPSVSLALDGATLREAGAAAPSLADFAVTFSRGSITLLGVQQAYRSGAQNLAGSFLYTGGDAASKTLPSTVALGSTQYNYRAYYNAGPQPYDNKGKAYGSPLPAGYVDSNAVSIYGTLPWYATTSGSTAGNPAKQALIRWNTTAGAMATPEFTLLPTDTCAQVISVPREITEILVKDAAGAFLPSSLGAYTKTTETRDGRTYYKYTYTAGSRGSITLKIKF